MTMVANSVASPSPVTTADIESPPITVTGSIMTFEAKESTMHHNNSNIADQCLNQSLVVNHDEEEDEEEEETNLAPGCSSCRQLHSDIQISVIRIAEKLDRLALRVEELFAYQQQHTQQTKNNDSNNYNNFLRNNNGNSQHASILDLAVVATAAAHSSTLIDNSVVPDSLECMKKYKKVFFLIFFQKIF